MRGARFLATNRSLMIPFFRARMVSTIYRCWQSISENHPVDRSSIFNQESVTHSVPPRYRLSATDRDSLNPPKRRIRTSSLVRNVNPLGRFFPRLSDILITKQELYSEIRSAWHNGNGSRIFSIGRGRNNDELTDDRALRYTCVPSINEYHRRHSEISLPMDDNWKVVL